MLTGLSTVKLLYFQIKTIRWELVPVSSGIRIKVAALEECSLLKEIALLDVAQNPASTVVAKDAGEQVVIAFLFGVVFLYRAVVPKLRYNVALLGFNFK